MQNKFSVNVQNFQFIGRWVTKNNKVQLTVKLFALQTDVFMIMKLNLNNMINTGLEFQAAMDCFCTPDSQVTNGWTHYYVKNELARCSITVML